MRLPEFTSYPPFRGRVARQCGLAALVLSLFAATALSQTGAHELLERERGHDSSQWVDLAAHLPDRVTSRPETLEREGDILRARRFPQDANDFYNFALQNGGSAGPLLDKIGLTELDMRDVNAARAYFKRVISIDRHSADGWNNLGVVEHISGRLLYAVQNYGRAVRLDPARAIFHSNLAMAYLDLGEQASAGKEIAAALRLDPNAFDADCDAGGSIARVLTSEGRVRLSFQLARFYAGAGQLEAMLHALASATEGGMDLRRAMRHDRLLARYRDDPRLAVLDRNAQVLRLIGEEESSGSEQSTAASAGDERPQMP